MARQIESPGVEINEIDLSLNASLPVGTNVLINGFTDSGPTQEILNITSLEEYRQIYGVPTNAAERYAFHTTSQLLNTNANVLFNRLPYGDDEGEGFNGNEYTALLYPVTTYHVDGNISAISGIDGETLPYGSNIPIGEEGYQVIGKPTLVTLTESEYNQWRSGEINWETSGGNSINTKDDVGKAGIVVVNKLKTSVNEDFEGYYVVMSDNLKAGTTPTSQNYEFDSITTVYSSKNANENGVVPVSGWSILSQSRFDFPLSGSITNPGSLSESIETIPTWDFGSKAYNDAIILGVYKFRRSGIGVNENALTYVPYETFVGALGSNRKYTPPNSFQEASFSIEKMVEDDSLYLDVMVNPNLANIKWLGDDGNPQYKVRVLSSEVTAKTGITGDNANAAFTLGGYRKKDAKKVIGSVPQKLELALELVADFERYPLDIVVDGGLSTISTITQLSSAGDGEYDDVAKIPGDFDNLLGAEGESSDTQSHWQTIFNKFDTFCRDTRKDCFFIADCLRHQLVRGKNFKILSDNNKNFSQHVFVPMKNLVSMANSSYSAIYAQWAQVFDNTANEFVWVPFSGFQAAIMARVDANRYPWFAPAGLENGVVRGVTDIALNTTQKQRDLLYRNNINAVVFFPNDGIVTWGQKTLQKKPSAFDRINVRRLFLTLEKGTRDVMKYFVFQPNTIFTRTRVSNVLTPIFDVAKNNEGLYDYLIVCDERNNTSSVIDNNELKVDIYLKPVRAAEFILVNFYATRTDQNFSELI